MKRRDERKRGRRRPRARRQPRREPPRIVLQGPFCSAGLPISQNKDIPARRLPDRPSCSPELSAGRDLVCRLEGAGGCSLCGGSCFPGGPESGNVETRGKAKVTASHPTPRHPPPPTPTRAQGLTVPALRPHAQSLQCRLLCLRSSLHGAPGAPLGRFGLSLPERVWRPGLLLSAASPALLRLSPPWSSHPAPTTLPRSAHSDLMPFSFSSKTPRLVPAEANAVPLPRADQALAPDS